MVLCPYLGSVSFNEPRQAIIPEIVPPNSYILYIGIDFDLLYHTLLFISSLLFSSFNKTLPIKNRIKHLSVTLPVFYFCTQYAIYPPTYHLQILLAADDHYVYQQQR